MYFCVGQAFGAGRRLRLYKSLVGSTHCCTAAAAGVYYCSIDDDAIGAWLLYSRYGRCCRVTAVVICRQACTESTVGSYEFTQSRVQSILFAESYYCALTSGRAPVI